MKNNVFINNFDNKKTFLMLIIIYNKQEIFKIFYFNLLRKIDLSIFNVVIINNNFPLESESDDYYQKIAINNKYTYINTNHNIGFLNSFIFIEKLFRLHTKNKHMILFNCEADSFITIPISIKDLILIKEKLENECGYIFLNNEYWEKIIENTNEPMVKMLNFEHEAMTHVQCFFHQPSKTIELDKQMRYQTVRRTISDMIKENSNIWIANRLKQDFYIYKKTKEKLNLLKNKILFEYFFFKRMQYWFYMDKKIIYNKENTFEEFLLSKKTFNIKKLVFSFIFRNGFFMDKNYRIDKKEKNIFFVNNEILFFLIKAIIKKSYREYRKDFYFFYKKDINLLTKIIYFEIKNKYKIFDYFKIDKIIKRKLKTYQQLKENGAAVKPM